MGGATHHHAPVDAFVILVVLTKPYGFQQGRLGGADWDWGHWSGAKIWNCSDFDVGVVSG